MPSGTQKGATVMVAAELSFGSPDATDARALDVSGAGTAYSLLCRAESFNSSAGAFKQSVRQVNDITLAGGVPSVEVDSIVNGSGNVKQVKATVTLRGDLRGFGSTAITSSGMGVLLQSGFAVTSRTPGTSCTATEDTTTTFTVGGGDLGKFAKGDIVAVEQLDGTFRFVKITGRNSGTNTLTCLTPHGIPNGQTATVRQCHMVTPSTGGATSSILLQFSPADGGQTQLGVGGRLMSLAFESVGDSAVEWVAEVELVDGEYSDAATIAVSTPKHYGINGTTACKRRVAPVRVSDDHSAETAPFAVDDASIKLRSWTAKVTNTLQPVADQATRCGRSGTSITQTIADVSFPQDAPGGGEVDGREVLRLGERRALYLTAAGANAAGNGFCFFVANAQPQEDPGITYADDDRTQVFSARAGDYAGDETGSNGGDARNTPWVIAWVA